MHLKSILALLVSVALVVLAGCAKDEPATDEDIQSAAEQVQQEVAMVKDETPKAAVIEKVVEQQDEAPSMEDSLLEVRTFYFDYDKADLREIALQALDVHAAEIMRRAQSNPGLNVTVEGHADERGTIDYNNALGNRRAEAVARYLRIKGVPASNIETVSYGELRPVSDDHNEAAWQLNRRTVVNY